MRHRSDRDTDDSIVSRPAESVVSNRTGVLPVRVNPISTGMSNQGTLEAGPNVVVGTADLECDIRICSHVVKVAGRSVDINYPICSVRGCGAAHYCATTTRNPEADGLTSSMQGNPKGPGGAQNICMCESLEAVMLKCVVLRENCAIGKIGCG